MAACSVAEELRESQTGLFRVREELPELTARLVVMGGERL